MDLTKELMGGLLTPSPYESPENSDYPKDPEWICQLINNDPIRGQQYIDEEVKNCETHAQKMKFLYGLRVCFEYSIKDLEYYLEDGLYPVSCGTCSAGEDSENRIRHYRSALLKVDSAICFELECSKIPCAPQNAKQCPPGLSCQQWTLAFHVFFKTLNIDTSNGSEVNLTLIARMLHLVTGDDCPEVFNNSKYLSYLKTAPLFKRTNGKQTVLDLEAVQVHFERVGFSEASKTINTMLVQYRKLNKTY